MPVKRGGGAGKEKEGKKGEAGEGGEGGQVNGDCCLTLNFKHQILSKAIVAVFWDARLLFKPPNLSLPFLNLLLSLSLSLTHPLSPNFKKRGIAFASVSYHHQIVCDHC